MFRTKKDQINMTEGPLLGKMIRFAIPLILSNLLQLFYHSADMFVVGNYCDNPYALGAVGCTGSINTLIIGLMLGMSAGISVTVSQSIGSRDSKRIERAVHTAVVMAVVVGFIVGVIGFFLAPVLLELMDTPAEFIDQSTLYVKIYFLGAIANAMFNFCAGILRSKGDAIRPMIYSSIGGIVNVGLNLVLVLVFGMGVEGVAIATVVSLAISATLSLIYLTRIDDPCKIVIKKLRIDRQMLMSFIRIGIPAGIQGMLFSFSNMLLQGSYNSLGPIYVNANTAAANIDGYVYNILTAFYQVALNFMSQNYGAKKYDRMKKIFVLNCVLVTVVGLTFGLFSYIFSDPLIGIFDSNPQVIALGKDRLMILGVFYFLCGLMETGTASLRSIGKSMTATGITVFGSCVLRILWVETVFKLFPHLLTLYYIYPITWILTFSALTIAFFTKFRKIIRNDEKLS